MAINWTNVNVPTILAVAGAAWGVFSYIQGLDSRLTKMEEYRVTRSAVTDDKFEQISRANAVQDQKIDGLGSLLSNLPYRVGVLESAILETGKRMDRMSDAVIQGRDETRKDLNAVSVKLEVISSKLDDIVPQRKADASERLSIPARN